MYTMCFTGHRKINGVYIENNPLIHTLIRNFCLNEISLAISQGFTTFVVGGAPGTDTIAADAVVYAKQYYNPNISMVLAKPYEGQERIWPNHLKTKYYQHVNAADEVVVVSKGGFEAWKNFKRNEWMVKKSHRVIGIWDDRTGGGTHHCIHYALTNRKQVVVYNPLTKERKILQS
jgi:uncharacterized phage-like protein YoqJ